MDTIKLGKKKYEIKFTTYSLSKLKTLNFDEINVAVNNGQVFAILETLIDLTYALVSTQGTNISKERVGELLDEAFSEGVNPVELLEALIKGLTDNPFFKAVQQK